MPYKNPKDPRKLAYISEYQIRQQYESRIALIELLGGKCVACGYADTRALCVDHVNGAGSAEGRRYGWTRYKIIAKKVAAGSKEYQVLCANCNQIKKIEMKEQPQKRLVDIV